MRLLKVEIEDYKQYSGLQHFMPGERAMVAIIGANGAGKSTLFEAIEWCLYNPSRITNASIQPRVIPGKPRVRVVLEDQHTGLQYEVERSLKSGSTQAFVYRSDNPENPVVQGTKQVTEYVIKEITGLSHVAFDSTFFTRQQELSFFGGLGPTDRRHEVGRLLGLETIRIAQQSIGDRRLAKQTEAKVKQIQFDEASGEVDFEAERVRLGNLIAECQTAKDEATAVADRALDELKTASAQRERQQVRFARFSEYETQIARLNGEEQRLRQQIESGEATLAQIAAADQEVRDLITVADREPDLRLKVETHDAALRLADERNQMATQLDQLRANRRQMSDRYAQLTNSVPQPATTLSQEDVPISLEMQRAIAQYELVDVEARRAELQTATDLVAADARLTSCKQTYDRYRQLLLQLRDEAQSVGDPVAALLGVSTSKAEHEQRAAAATSLAGELGNRADTLGKLLRSLEREEFGERCPTCARPFQPGEAAATLTALRTQLDELGAQREQELQNASIASSLAVVLTSEEQSLNGRVTALSVLNGRIESGTMLVQQTEAEVNDAVVALNLLLAGAKRDRAPGEAEIAQLKLSVEEAQRQREMLQALRELHAQSTESDLQFERLSASYENIGDPHYDQLAHQRSYDAWESSRNAIARIEILQRQVAARPQHETLLAETQDRLQAAELERANVVAAQSDLGFSQMEFERANEAEHLAANAERGALNAQHAADIALREAIRERKDRQEQQRRLASLQTEAAAARSEAEQLDRIYKEFARFEQFVAVNVTPMLAERASGLLAAVTDGKYDRMEFTEDYGIEVYDSGEDHFPIALFSGGERDVMALCARLALSQLLGGQAANPIQFMVLDEVFGSLDRSRRENVLQTLRRIVEDTGAFQQLFVISHIDDIRIGSMFDEVWQVTETESGVSRLERVDGLPGMAEN